MDGAVSSSPRTPPWRGWPWLLSLASGVLLVLCFPPFDQGWLVWIALTPLVAALWWRRSDTAPAEPAAASQRWWRRLLPRRHPFWLGYLAGVIYFAGTFHWLATLGVLFQSPALYGLPLLLGMYMALYPALWAWFLHALVPPSTAAPFASSLRNLGFGIAAASAWVALEWWRSWFLSGFNWNMLAVAMRRDVAMIQIAEITGAYGLSWLLVFANVMALVVVRRLVAELGPNFLRRVRWEFSATMAVIGAVFAFGVHALFARPVASIPLRVAALQPNIPQAIKFAGPDEEDRIFATLSRNNQIATSMLPPPQLVVWPESATPRGIFADEVNLQFVREEASRGGYGLLLGSLESEPDPNDSESMLVYNSAVLLTEGGRREQAFRKNRLVIFGEYLPYRALMPEAIAELIPGDLSAGHELNVLTLPDPGVQIGALVCFEDTAPDVASGLVRKGAQVLVNITNDGWFLHSAGLEQHFANAILRTVENRRPLLRSTNTGVTGSVDAFGRVERWVEPFHEGVGMRTVAVPAGSVLTFYARHGDWLAYLSVLVTAAVLALKAARARRERRAARKGE